MMKSELAKARDKWFAGDDGRECCKGQTSGIYLQNRLERAFLAGAKFSNERIKELETTLKKYGQHLPWCDKDPSSLTISQEKQPSCSCGFVQAVKDK